MNRITYYSLWDADAFQQHYAKWNIFLQTDETLLKKMCGSRNVYNKLRHTVEHGALVIHGYVLRVDFWHSLPGTSTAAVYFGENYKVQ